MTVPASITIPPVPERDRLKLVKRLQQHASVFSPNNPCVHAPRPPLAAARPPRASGWRSRSVLFNADQAFFDGEDLRPIAAFANTSGVHIQVDKVQRSVGVAWRGVAWRGVAWLQARVTPRPQPAAASQKATLGGDWNEAEVRDAFLRLWVKVCAVATGSA